MYTKTTNMDQTENEINNRKQEPDKKLKAMAIWILSAMAHCIVLAALVFWVITQKQTKEEKIVTTELMEKEETPINEKLPLDLKKEKIIVKVDPEIFSNVEILNKEISKITETDNNESEQQPQGAEDAKSDKPLIGTVTLGNIGDSGSVGSIIGKRNPIGRKILCGINGGDQNTEQSVEWALWWLANHQEKDGHWDSGKYEGNGTPEVDSAVTGASLLAFLSAGYTDKAGKWKTNVKNGLAWLVMTQRPNGSWDSRNYSNGICTMAMAEAAGMGCGGSEVKKSAELAVDFLLKQQNASGCFDYTGPSTRDDMSVTGWCIMALKSALISGIKEKEIKEAFHKCGEFLDKTNGTNDNTSTSQGLGWYTPDSLGSGKAGGACQAIAMLVRQYLGWDRSAPWLQSAADGQISKIPEAYDGMDVYRVYYSYLTLFQQGGKHWKAWNKPVSKILVASQRQDGDFRGSWDKNGSHCDKGGRVLYTAFLCLSLEIYYRYEKISMN